MRIRRGRQTRCNIGASLAMASPPHMDDISQQLEHDYSSKQKIHESAALDLNVAEESFEKAPLELLERLQINSTGGVLIPPNRPYMNLDEFVTSLARTNCFPAEDDSDYPHSDEDYSDDQHNNFRGQSCCSLTRSSVLARGDEESPNFGRMFGAVSFGSGEELRGDIAVVETSLRLATPSSMAADLHYKPANPRTSTTAIEAGAAAAIQAEQTMKSSAEYVEQWSGRHTRVSSSPGSKSNRTPSPASLFPTTDQTETQEEASSDFSIQMAESSRKPRSKQRTTPRIPESLSSSTLKTATSTKDASEERNQKLGKPVAKRMMKRSGRPKKLKYLQQDNLDELGNQCNRRDGKGWTCPLLAKPGYQLCDHHLDKLRCKPGSRAKYNKSKKKKTNKGDS